MPLIHLLFQLLVPRALCLFGGPAVVPCEVLSTQPNGMAFTLLCPSSALLSSVLAVSQGSPEMMRNRPALNEEPA